MNLKSFVCCFTLLTLFCQQQGGNNGNTKRERNTFKALLYFPSATSKQLRFSVCTLTADGCGPPLWTEPNSLWSLRHSNSPMTFSPRIYWSLDACSGLTWSTAGCTAVQRGRVVPTCRVTFPLLSQQLLNPGDLPLAFILQVRGFRHNQWVNGWCTYTQTETSPPAAHTHTQLSGCHQINCCRPRCSAAVRADAAPLIDASHVIASRARLHLFHYLFSPARACEAVCLPR